MAALHARKSTQEWTVSAGPAERLPIVLILNPVCVVITSHSPSHHHELDLDPTDLSMSISGVTLPPPSGCHVLGAQVVTRLTFRLEFTSPHATLMFNINVVIVVYQHLLPSSATNQLLPWLG